MTDTQSWHTAPWACEVCNYSSVTILHVSRDTGQQIGRCRSCRLVTVLNQLPPDAVSEMYNSAEGFRIYVEAQRVESLRRRHLEAVRRLNQYLPEVPNRTLFDVGAGAGDFLSRARAAGFEVYGNDISEPAAQECHRRYGISLATTDLSEEPGADRFDAVTMWCVLAHVGDPRQLLTDAFRLLKPHGVLYFHTPRWCLIDVAGLAATRLTRGTEPTLRTPCQCRPHASV